MKEWDTLSEDYRRRLIRHGITRYEYESGATLRIARGHGYRKHSPLYEKIKRLVDWLDDCSTPGTEETGLRIMKIQEEAGEAAQAWINYRGQNPRRPRGSIDMVTTELADVVVTALVALESVTGNAQTHVHNRLNFLIRRMEDLSTINSKE